jgi:hypothetical protein
MLNINYFLVILYAVFDSAKSHLRMAQFYQKLHKHIKHMEIKRIFIASSLNISLQSLTQHSAVGGGYIHPFLFHITTGLADG